MNRCAAVLARPVPAAAGSALVALPLILVATLSFTAAADPQPVDFRLFGPAGAQLLEGHWSTIYGDPLVQAGPFELLPWGLLQVLGISGRWGWTIALTVCAVLTAFFTALVLRPTTAPDVRSSLLAAAGTLLLSSSGPIAGTWTIGHPSEVVVPLVWVLAARCAIREQPVVAASLIAMSSGLEVWGVLAAPVVLLAARPRPVAAAVAAGAVLVVLWGPFIAVGPFRMFAFAWDVSGTSLLHLLLPEARSAPWSWRVIQAVLAVGAGCAVALLLRSRRPAWAPWCVVVAVVSGRLVLDPVLADYYGYPILVGAAGALVLAAHRRNWAAFVGSACCSAIAWVNEAPALTAALLLAGVLAGALALRHRSGPASTGAASRSPLPASDAVPGRPVDR